MEEELWGGFFPAIESGFFPAIAIESGFLVGGLWDEHVFIVNGIACHIRIP